MIPDFKGHHFLEDSKPGEPPSTHHCDQCGLKVSLRPGGSAYFDFERNRCIPEDRPDCVDLVLTARARLDLVGGAIGMSLSGCWLG
jgi:hypothetical protein